MQSFPRDEQRSITAATPRDKSYIFLSGLESTYSAGIRSHVLKAHFASRFNERRDQTRHNGKRHRIEGAGNNFQLTTKRVRLPGKILTDRESKYCNAADSRTGQDGPNGSPIPFGPGLVSSDPFQSFCLPMTKYDLQLLHHCTLFPPRHMGTADSDGL